jgi:probable phosphoglycerate mutase
MRIYFARHGKTDGNTKRFIPSAQEPLNADGKGDAEFLVRRLEATPIEMVFSGNFTRAKETATLIAEKKDIPLTILPELNELSRGDHLHGKYYADAGTKEELDAWWLHLEAPDGAAIAKEMGHETYADLKSRAEKVLETLRQRPEECISVVTHSATLRMLLGLIVFRERLTPAMFKDLFFNLDMRTTGISIAEYTEEKGWRMLVWNDCAHLADPR